MKITTKAAILDIEQTLLEDNFRRVRFGVYEALDKAGIAACVSIGYREWADGVCSLQPYLHIYWHELEKIYDQRRGKTHKRFFVPTLSKFVLFDPQLVAPEPTPMTANGLRVRAWWYNEGIHTSKSLTDPYSLFLVSLDALQNRSLIVYAEKVYLMDRALRPKVDEQHSFELVVSKLKNEQEIADFQKFYENQRQV